MIYEWKEYTADDGLVVESFFDEVARRLSGCDEGWEDYYHYQTTDSNTNLGQNFWAKVISFNKHPIAIISIGLYEGVFIVSEFIVAPDFRGKGHGSAILNELLLCGQSILGVEIKKAFAVIFPNNHASMRTFEKAGFVFFKAHSDGDAWYYTYTKKLEESS